LQEQKNIRVEIRRAAMNMLARREQTRKELKQKLKQKFPEEVSLIDDVLMQLADESLQSDERFADNFVRWRVARGYGLIKIKMELTEKGISEEIQYAVCKQVHSDVADDSIMALYARKYGQIMPATIEEKAKIQRYFLSRGFSSAQIQTLWRKIENNLLTL